MDYVECHIRGTHAFFSLVMFLSLATQKACVTLRAMTLVHASWQKVVLSCLVVKTLAVAARPVLNVTENPSLGLFATEGLYQRIPSVCRLARDIGQGTSTYV